MKYTLGTAAKATGKSKATIHRAVKSGKLSAFIRDDGSYEIDPSELYRVYQPASENSSEETGLRQSATQEETALLRQENDFLKQYLERERETVSDLRRRLDNTEAARQKEAEAREEASVELRRLTQLLTHQPEPRIETPLPVPPIPKTPPEKGELWKKLFGRLNGFPEYER